MEQCTYPLAGMMRPLSSQMASERLSLREEIPLCRFHIHQHYDIYKERCEKADISVNHWAIPWPIWIVKEAAKDAEKRGWSTKKRMQQTLRFKTMNDGPYEFTRTGALHAVAMLIATNNQVSCQDIPAAHRKVNDEPTAPRACG